MEILRRSRKKFFLSQILRTNQTAFQNILFWMAAYFTSPLHINTHVAAGDT